MSPFFLRLARRASSDASSSSSRSVASVANVTPRRMETSLVSPPLYPRLPSGLSYNAPPDATIARILSPDERAGFSAEVTSAAREDSPLEPSRATDSSADATDSRAEAPSRAAARPRGGRPAPELPLAPGRICRRSSAAGSRVSFSRSRDSSDAFRECAGLLRSLSPVKEEFAGEPASDPPSSGSLPYCAIARAAGGTRAPPQGASKPRAPWRVPPARSKPRLFRNAGRRRAISRTVAKQRRDRFGVFGRRAGA